MARFSPKLKARQSAFGVRRYSYLLGFTGVKFPLVELRRIELLTSSLRTTRSPS
jgi:hypothetical protein